MSRTYHIAVLPGDGIGPELITQAYKVLDAIRYVSVSLCAFPPASMR